MRKIKDFLLSEKNYDNIHNKNHKFLIREYAACQGWEVPQNVNLKDWIIDKMGEIRIYNEPKKKNQSTIEIAEEFAEARKKAPTRAERSFRALLRSVGVKFIPEKVIYNKKSFYIIDFYIPDRRLCIELDGGYHNEPEQKEKDVKRDKYLKGLCYNVWRMTNEEASDLTRDDLYNKIQEYPIININPPIRILPTADEKPAYYKPKRLKGNPISKKQRKPSKPVKTNFPHLDEVLANKRKREENRLNNNLDLR